MAFHSIISIFFVIFSALLLSTESQELLRKRDDLSQQIHAKVERINLKDFGIERQTPVQREDDQRIKEVEARRRFHAPRTDPRLERRPDSVSGDTYDSYPGRRHSRDGNRRSHTGSDERERENPTNPSPIDWSLSPRRTGLAFDSDLSSRRAYNLSSDLGNPLDRRLAPKHTKNCSEVCVDRRYLQHYYTKGCKELTDYECKCAVGFDCPSHKSNNSTGCQYDGRVYQIGSRIPIRNPCRICECRNFGRRRGEILAEIDCGINIECPEEVFGLKPEPNCYFAYEKDKCCGQQVCANTLQPKRDQKVCKYKGKEYRKGEKIYPEEDNCKICHCNDDWNDANPLASPACRTYRCEFELDKDFSNGCLPIYHEGTCCPIEYKCPKRFLLSTQTPDPSQCVFDGRKYPIGSRLVTENVCVDCVCRAPPDFTCVHKSCPTPPTNCYVGKWDNSVCCQRYVCARPDHIRDESQFRHNFYSNKDN